jgi:hypothetical protein
VSPRQACTVQQRLLKNVDLFQQTYQTRINQVKSFSIYLSVTFHLTSSMSLSYTSTVSSSVVFLSPRPWPKAPIHLNICLNDKFSSKFSCKWCRRSSQITLSSEAPPSSFLSSSSPDSSLSQDCPHTSWRIRSNKELRVLTGATGDRSSVAAEPSSPSSPSSCIPLIFGSRFIDS